MCFQQWLTHSSILQTTWKLLTHSSIHRNAMLVCINGPKLKCTANLWKPSLFSFPIALQSVSKKKVHFILSITVYSCSFTNNNTNASKRKICAKLEQSKALALGILSSSRVAVTCISITRWAVPHPRCSAEPSSEKEVAMVTAPSLRAQRCLGSGSTNLTIWRTCPWGAPATQPSFAGLALNCVWSTPSQTHINTTIPYIPKVQGLDEFIAGESAEFIEGSHLTFEVCRHRSRFQISLMCKY